MLILAGPVPSSLCDCAGRGMKPLISDGVISALGLMHMVGPALHLNAHLNIMLVPVGFVLSQYAYECSISTHV